MRSFICASATIAAPLCVSILVAQIPEEAVWRFDNLDRIGGYHVEVEGHPRLIQTPAGKAVEFNGIDDALFIGAHPLAGAQQFTWEVVFRPDAGGRHAQRFFHLQGRDPATGQDTAGRMLFEIRVIGEKWAVDGFIQSGTKSQVLYDDKKLHSLNKWHHVAVVYDGKDYRNFVDGVQEGAAAIQLAPQVPGHSSIGVRINHVDYFKGAVLLARMTNRPLAPAEFLKPPDS